MKFGVVDTSATLGFPADIVPVVGMLGQCARMYYGSLGRADSTRKL